MKLAVLIGLASMFFGAVHFELPEAGAILIILFALTINLKP